MGLAKKTAAGASKVEAADKLVVATQASVSSLASDVEAMQATVAAEMAQAKVAAEAPRPAVRHMIHRAIEAAFADRTGMVDYAIEVAGAQIVRRLTSKTFDHSYSARISEGCTAGYIGIKESCVCVGDASEWRTRSKIVDEARVD